MNRKKSWQQFEDLICGILKEIDPHARPTKASGASTEKGDIKTSTGLHIECKERNLKSVYNEDWMQKCIEEVPFHSDNIPVLFTRNNKGKMRAILDAEEFLRLYIELYKYRNGE